MATMGLKQNSGSTTTRIIRHTWHAGKRRRTIAVLIVPEPGMNLVGRTSGCMACVEFQEVSGGESMLQSCRIGEVGGGGLAM